MSNSPLVKYTKLSPNCSTPRNRKIDTITIHHMAGPLSASACGDIFFPAGAGVSSNYSVDKDAIVGMYVEEKNRSWCSSNPDNDHRAITIEVANDGGAPDWHVSTKVLNKLIELCTDICKRNGIPCLNYTGDATGNLTRHNMFKATACPGPYLQSKFPYIADEVNKRLGVTATATNTKPTAAAKPAASKLPYQVRCVDPKVNIRQKPDIKSADVGDILGTEVYTIIEEAKGPGAKLWGKLKSGAGWVALDYFERV